AIIVGIAVDAESRLLFYTDRENDVIGVISLDNFAHKTILRNVIRPGDIVADPINGYIYWAEHGIFRVNLEMSNYDGTNRKRVIEIRNEFFNPFDSERMMDLDFKDGDLYLCENKHTIIRRVNASSYSGNIIYETEEGAFTCSISVHQSSIYFIFNRKIKRLGTDGAGEPTIPFQYMRYPTVIHAHSNSSIARNGCSGGRGGCSHFCFPLPGGSRMCSCPDIMTLLPDHQTCEGSSILLIATNDRSSILAIDLNIGHSIQVPLQNLGKPHAVSYDHITGTIFWTDITLRMILSATVSGRNEKAIRHLKVNSSPQGIAIDATSRILFYTDRVHGIIAVLSLDGSSEKVIVRNKFEEPDDIVTNPVNGTIFWTSFGTYGKIETANYDGTSNRELINTGNVEPSGLAIDITEGVLYWCVAGSIFKADVNGMHPQLIYKDNNVIFQRIAFHESNLYFTSPSHRNVMKGGIDGGRPTRFGPTTSGYIVDIHVFKGADTKDSKGCSNPSSTCSHFCFPRPGGLKMCACPDDMSLQSDGRTCQTSITSLPTNTTMNTQSDQPLDNHHTEGSAVVLTVLRTAVGFLVCFLAISVLLNVCLVRRKIMSQTEDTKSEYYAVLMSRKDEVGQNQTVSEAIIDDNL
ncbi:hypothetical protein ACJMK2_022707, partial [Sinanodonta woodiana]